MRDAAAHVRVVALAPRNATTATLVMHARFEGASQALIASSSGRATCQLEVLTVDGDRQRDVFVRKLDEKMRRDFRGRPTWGKDLVRPWTIAETHGTALEEFLEIRAEMDPPQRILNPSLRDEVFGLGRRVRASRPSLRG